MMKALVLHKYGFPNQLKILDIPRPVPADDEVLVKVQAASVNDWDWGLIRGKPFYIRLLCGLSKPKVQVPGVDIAGWVESVGKNVTRFKVGDEVYGDLSESGFGGFAEYACVPEQALALKSAAMSFEEAAALPHAAMLAMQGLFDVGGLQPDHTLLINGAGGGVGTLALQMAKNAGVKHVVGVDSLSKQEMMIEAGFDQVVDYRQQDFTRSQQHYDLILDTKTNRPFWHYLRVLKPSGAYVTVGGDTSKLLQAFLFGSLVWNRFSPKKIRIVALKPNKDLGAISELFDSERIKPVIDGPYDFCDAAKAIQHFGIGIHLGKVIIRLNQA